MELTEGLLALLLITAVFSALFIIGRNEVVRRRVTCPRTGGSAEVDVVQRYHEPDRPVRVRQCSILPDPRHVDCGQGCLHTS